MLEKGCFILTNPQKSIWNMGNYYSESNISNICAVGIIQKAVNIPLLIRAANSIVEKNDAFRITISVENGIPVQKITKHKQFDIDVIDILDNDALQKLEKKSVNERIDFFDSQLYRFKIARFPDNHVAVILTLNHIIADSWALGLVIQEILRQYYALENNNTIDLNYPSYTDYVISENNYKDSNKFKRDKSFWNDLFSDIPNIATIPSNKKNTALVSCEAKRLSFSFDKEYVDKINSLCKSINTSAFNFFFSIYSLYLSKVTNLDDFVIGTPILNRSNISEKNTIGMFVNTVPVRIKIPKNISFIDFIHNLSTNMIGVLKHQKYSYSQILEDIHSQNNNVSKLYNVLISYQITKAYNSDIGGYETKWIFNNCSENDLNIHITDINDTGSLEINYDYKIDKYDTQDIKNIHERICHVINKLLTAKSLENVNTSDITIATLEEQEKLIYTNNSTSSNYPKNQTIIDLFEKQVEKTPNNTAVSFEGEKISYLNLNKKANKLASYLKSIGINRHDVVSILQTKTPDLLISILAVLKVGACYVPIDPEYPEERIKTILDDSNSKLLITNTYISFKNKIDIDEFDYENSLDEDFKNSSNPKDLAYIIYTSGSTGKPKGVAIEHRSLLNYIYWANKFYCNFKETNFPLYTSISFDLTITSIFTPLINGGTVLIYREKEIYDTLEKIFSDGLSNIVKLTPAHLTLVNELKLDSTQVEKLILGGDILSSDLCKKTVTKFNNIRIFNEYGPTEATVGCMIYEYNKDVTEFDAVLVGKPIDNTQIYILDSNLNIQATGIEGEMYIAGSGLARCYLNDEEKTKASFIPNPFIKGTYMYKTGDSGVCYEDGNINCFGRLDNQIKLRGQRIELAEIENKINSVDGVTTSVVIKKKESSYEYLVAYYETNKDVSIQQIQKVLEKYLPKYMLPHSYVKLPKMLYTTNGKIDRKRLALIESSEKEEKTIVPPRNQTDKELLNILKELLGKEILSIDDSFFNVDGDSLSAISLCIRVQDRFGIKLSVKDILNNSLISEISDTIKEYQIKTKDEIINRVYDQTEYNVSPSQKMIYFASKVAGNNSALYNTPGGLIIHGKIDSSKLQKCLNELVARHESFRTYFESNGEKVIQKVEDKLDFKLDIIKQADRDKIDDYYKRFVRPFDLSKAPLLRCELLDFTNEDCAFFLDMHHIISDGTSLTIFMRELLELYNDISLDPVDITYKDFAEYENKRIKLGKLKEDEDYWMNKFKDEVTALNIYTPKPRQATQNYEGKNKYFRLNTNIVKKIMEFSKRNDMTLNTLLLACYYILLLKYTSQNDITVGISTSGRTKKQTENLIGVFVNSLPIRVKIDGNDSIKNFLLKIKTELLEGLDHQEYPFGELVSNLGIPRYTGRNPLFDTMFIFQNAGVRKIKFAGYDTMYYIPDNHISKFDLSLECIPRDDEILFRLEYATSLFTKEFIDNLTEHYINIVKSVIENTEITVDNINMLSIYEKNQIVYEFNETDLKYPSNKTISELFEEQVKKTPDNIAVVFGDKQLSYKELNEKADCLASYLQKTSNIEPDDLVGIMVNRSLEMIISILAVLKAGGAYIPIDPTYPKDRISYMLNSSNSKVLLTLDSLKENIEYNNIICVDLDNNLYSSSKKLVKNASTPENLAYVIFTSGSTGLPKGVMLKQKNITNFIFGMMDIFKFTQNDSIASITTMSFDIFVLESLLPLLNGLKIVIANEEEQANVKAFNTLCIKNNCSVIQTTPSRLQSFMLNSTELDFIKRAKYILIGGEPFPKSLLSKLRNISKARIFNMYGPTETAVWSSVKELDSNDITIGKPIANTQIYNLDHNLNPMPIGVPGELYISGDGVSRGYLNNPKKTSEAFLKNPFLPNSIMYRTGDSGFFRNDGDIVCLGRIDNQIKIRGLRIELEEIESVLLKHPYIKKACVVKKDINNREFIISYLVANRRIVINELRNYLANWLPRYMVPTYYVFLDDLPYTPSGKVNKKELPLPEKILNIEKETYTAPKTFLQKRLVEIWERILNIKPVGINDNFFELGGDSLLAMNLNVELTSLTNKISYQDIFRYPTIAELESKITSNDSESLFGKIENIPGDFEKILKDSGKPKKMHKNTIKNVLLTGGTGFLGIHILEQFIINSDNNIYCIIRNDPGISAKTKLCQKLHYYFGDKYDDLIDTRIFALEGDITKENFGLGNKEIAKLASSVGIVINSAANVSHFGNYKDFYTTNVLGVKNIIKFCKKYDKTLYHTSTTSVVGEATEINSLGVRKNKNQKTIFDESKLYVGQSIENVYARSKFEAECTILEAIGTGLDAYIFRMGNLMPRFSDGKFQENLTTNAFVNRINAFIELGIIPDYIKSRSLEFTPIDLASNAIFRLIKYSNNSNRIFHIYNHHYVSMNRFLRILKRNGYSLEIVSDDAFKDKIISIIRNSEIKKYLNNLLNDFSKDLHLKYKIDIIMKSDITKKILRKTFFIWPRISDRYLKNFIKILGK